MRRRRLLTGLSAASVAAALPSFVYGSTALAQSAGDSTLQIFSRLEGANILAPRDSAGDVESTATQYRLFVKSSAPTTFPRAVLQLRESYVRYDNGERLALHVTVTGPHSFPPFAFQRRVTPRIPQLTLSVDDEVLIATLTLRAAAPRNERAKTQIEMSLAGRDFTLPEVTVMA